MLSARVCRLLNIGNSQSSTEPAAVRTTAARLDETQRLARWRIFILKAFLMIDVFEHQRKVLYLLGADAYKRLCHRIQTQQEHGSQVAAAVTNVINGEAVGKPMKAGDGQATVDPMMCSHPTSAMKRRGNKKKWWTCTQCQSRWERHTLAEVTPEGVPQGTEVLLEGTHAGTTFSDIFETQPNYCRWVMITLEQGEEVNPQLTRLAHYLQQREALEDL